VSSISSRPIWTITFLERAGDVPDFVAEEYAISNVLDVTELTKGTIAAITGSFELTFNGGVETFSLSDSASVFKKKISNMTSVDVNTRMYPLPNYGVMIVVTFDKSAGNVDQLSIISTSLSGTFLDASVVTQSEGSTLEGFFTLGLKFLSGNYMENEQLMPYNVSANDFARAIHALSPSMEGVKVKRSAGEGYGTYSWTITFPVSLGDAGKLLLICICNFHVLSHLLMIYICKLHWNLQTFCSSAALVLSDPIQQSLAKNSCKGGKLLLIYIRNFHV
jgi:hypothetical protein